MLLAELTMLYRSGNKERPGLLDKAEAKAQEFVDKQVAEHKKA